MIISDLIILLEEMKKQAGDIEVVYDPTGSDMLEVVRCVKVAPTSRINSEEKGTLCVLDSAPLTANILEGSRSDIYYWDKALSKEEVLKYFESISEEL